MPSIGAVMVVWLRLTSAWPRAARACAICACADLNAASACAVADARRLELAGRQQLLAAQRLGAALLDLGVLERDPRPLGVGLQLHQVGPRLVDLGLEQRRLQPGDHLPLLHLRVEVGLQRGDGAGDLASPPGRWSPPRACPSPSRSARRRRESTKAVVNAGPRAARASVVGGQRDRAGQHRRRSTACVVSWLDSPGRLDADVAGL